MPRAHVLIRPGYDCRFRSSGDNRPLTRSWESGTGNWELKLGIGIGKCVWKNSMPQSKQRCGWVKVNLVFVIFHLSRLIVVRGLF